MPHIRYNPHNFGRHWGTALTGSHELPVSWEELVWAAITVGKPGVAYLLAHGWHSFSDLIVRTHTVYANLKETSNRFEKSSLYNSLDPSEKSGISYFMGMAASKVVASRLLDTQWLFHVSMINSLGGTVTLIDKSQPDLIGQNNRGNWIVVEAKGRTGRHCPKAMRVAKSQTRQLRNVNGNLPTLRVAVQASFNPSLHFEIEDPEEYDEGARDLEFNVNDAMRMYYSSIISATEHGKVSSIENQSFVISELEDIGVTIGLAEKTRVRVMNSESLIESDESLSRSDDLEGGSRELPKNEKDHRNFEIFPDGIAIHLDKRWDKERMILEPSNRRGG